MWRASKDLECPIGSRRTWGLWSSWRINVGESRRTHSSGIGTQTSRFLRGGGLFKTSKQDKQRRDPIINMIILIFPSFLGRKQLMVPMIDKLRIRRCHVITFSRASSTWYVWHRLLSLCASRVGHGYRRSLHHLQNSGWTTTPLVRVCEVFWLYPGKLVGMSFWTFSSSGWWRINSSYIADDLTGGTSLFILKVCGYPCHFRTQ